ncbi:MAG: hypothetical protein PHN80_08020 [Hespellia sp.]|nr:hypothetical protein [Hespellia sp.]
MDIMFYDEKNEWIKGFKGVVAVPREGERITFDKVEEYTVIWVIHDYREEVIHVGLRKSNIQDLSFLR